MPSLLSRATTRRSASSDRHRTVESIRTPLSITASIFAALQLTSKVIEYLDNVQDAPKDCARLVTKASTLYSLLVNLKYGLVEARLANV